MRETSKAMTRRMSEDPQFWNAIFHGFGIDVGSGNDPLQLPHNVVHFNLPDGGGDRLTDFFGGYVDLSYDTKRLGRLHVAGFDFIHGSQVLEHAENPYHMLNSWVEMLRRGGFIIATVPDFTLYEKNSWPSRWNKGHRSTWSMDKTISPCPIHIKLPEWFERFPVSVTRCKLIDTNYDYSAERGIDQTFNPTKNVECFVEFVLQKK